MWSKFNFAFEILSFLKDTPREPEQDSLAFAANPRLALCASRSF